MSSWDPNFGLPVPPVDMPYATTACFWSSVAYLCVGVPILLYALYRIGHREGRMMLMILIGGALCSYVEPLADILGGCWHPEVGQPTVFKVLGRGIAPWTCIGYFTYFGGLGALGYLWFLRGATRRAIVAAFFIAVATDIFMENFFLHYQMYVYYGNQPLDYVGYLPLWWPPVNALGVLTGITFVLLLERHVKGAALLLVPLAFPIGDLVSYALISYPGAIAVNQPDLPRWATDLAGVAVWVLAAFMVRVVTNVLAQDSSFRQGNALIVPLPSSPAAESIVNPKMGKVSG